MSSSTLDQIGLAASVITGFAFVALAIWGILHMAKKTAKKGVQYAKDNPEVVKAAIRAAPLFLV